MSDDTGTTPRGTGGILGTETRDEKPGWHKPLPERIPEPTPWPAVIAFGATLMAFGVVTSWAFSVVGLVFLVVGVAGWVERMRHEGAE